MPDLTIYIVFWTVFIISFIITFKILQAIQIERIFKKYRQFEIQAAYLIITIIVSYLLASFSIDMIRIMPWY